MNARDYDHVPHQEIKRYAIQGLMHFDPNDKWSAVDFADTSDVAIRMTELASHDGGRMLFRVYDNHEHCVVWPPKEGE